MSDFIGYSNYLEMKLNDDGKSLCKNGLRLEHDNLILIDNNNIKLIENAKNSNEDYSFSFQNMVFEYFGGITGFPRYNYEAVLALIRIIDFENSTNAWRMKNEKREALKNIVEYIINEENGFWSSLENGEVDLVDKLSDASKGDNQGVEAKSLSSKVCKYLDELYGRDQYYINDQAVRRVLPYYLNYYRVEVDIEDYKNKKKTKGHYKYKIDDLSYKDLHSCLDALKTKVEITCLKKKITKSQLDLVLWYCYR